MIAYCWTEHEFAHNSNTIASCVFDALSSVDLSNYKNIRLVSDGCGGQNKNSIFISMCIIWLTTKAPSHIKEIELVFPVTGHSFLRSDRVFAYIEKKLKGMKLLPLVRKFSILYASMPQ